MDDKLLSETKKIVKSLIIPYQTGIGMRQLCADFVEMEGKPLPYKELGYSSLTAFLKSIPDVLRMYGSAYDPDPNNMIIFPVADESTRHIQELVGCQKKVPKRGGRGVSQRVVPRPRLNLNTRSHFTRANMFSNAIKPNYKPQTVVDYSKQTITRQPLLQYNPPVNPYIGHPMFTNNVLIRALDNLHSLHLKIKERLNSLSLQESRFNDAINILNGLTVDLCESNASLQLSIIKNLAINALKSHYLTISREQKLLDYQHSIVDEAINILNSQCLASNSLQTYNISHQQQQQTQPLPTNASKAPNTFKNWQNFTVSRNVSNNVNMQTSGANISVNESKPTAQPLSGNEVLQKSQSPFLPPDIKARIEKMMTSPELCDGIMLYNFEAQYKHCYKEAFEWKKLDFNSLADCLKSLPHILNLIPAGTSTFKIMPRLNKESSQQQQTTCDNTDSSSIRKQVDKTETIAIITTTAQTTVVTIITTSSVMSSTPTITTTTVSHMSRSISSSKVMSPIKSPQNNEFNQPEEDQQEEDEEMSSEENTISSPTANMPISTMAASNFRRILSRHKDGIPACLFAREYQKEFGVSFDSNIWGFVSPMEMFYSLSGIFAIQPSTSSTTLTNEVLFPGYGDEEFLHDARYRKFEIPNDSEKVKEKANLSYISHIPDIVTAQILKLIESNMPQGLALPYFTEEYRINYGSLNLAQFHIPNTRQLFELLEHVLPINVRLVDGNDRAFLKSAHEVESFICSCNRQCRYTFAKTMITDIPNGVVLPGEQLSVMTLPSDITVGNNEYSAVLISSAKDPANIWIQFKGDDYHSSLEQLMTELEFYNAIKDDEWLVPKQFICIDYPVVARFPGDRNWHRARILRLHAHNSVTVSFVDYGGITTTSINNLHLMKRQFLALETQALRVGLYGVKPYFGQNGWTISSRDCLLENFSKSEYFIACTFMEKIHDRYYLVVLCDTHDTNNDIFVHDVLIDEKHAVYDAGLCAQNGSIGATNDDNNNDDNDNQNNTTIGLERNNLLENSNAKQKEISEHDLLKAITEKLEKVNSFGVKWINWKRSKVAILLQKSNGPCSVIALFNYLSLSGRINLPDDVFLDISAIKLFSLLAQFTIISTKTLSKVVNTNMTTFTYNTISKFFGGLNVNVNFGNVKQFDITDEIKLFTLLNITLMHGWLIDPNDKLLYSLFGKFYYNDLTDYIVNSKLSNDDQTISYGLMAQQLLTSSQLTEYGLRCLYLSLENDQLSIFFRNNHFVILHKNENTLYQLLSDCSLINSCDAIWETLTNINGDEVFVNEDFISATHQNQLDYEMAVKLDKELNPTVNWIPVDWSVKHNKNNNNSVEPNDDNWDDEWNKFNTKNTENPRQIHSTVDVTDNSNLVHVPPMNESSAIVSSSDKLCVENDIKPTAIDEELSEHLLENSCNNLLGSTEELNKLPPPLVPHRASLDGDCNKADIVKINMDELKEAAQRVISESNSELNLIGRKENSPRKLTPSITITRNSDTGERKVLNNNSKVYENGTTIGVKNLERLKQLDFTPTNSDVDETETDNLLVHNVSNNIDWKSINEARVRPVIINRVYCHLFHYNDKYYFTYNAVNEIFKETALWQTIRKSGGYLKDRIQLTEQEGLHLFTRLDIKWELKSGGILLYPHESVLNMARINKLGTIKNEITTEVRKFHEDILIEEKSKLIDRLNQIEQKMKTGLKI